jgi:hypothetical protein
VTDGKVVRFRHRTRVELTPAELLEERLRNLEAAISVLAREVAALRADARGITAPGDAPVDAPHGDRQRPGQPPG